MIKKFFAPLVEYADVNLILMVSFIAVFLAIIVWMLRPQMKPKQHYLSTLPLEGEDTKPYQGD